MCFLPTAAFENEEDVTDFVKCKIESLVANKEQPLEGWFAFEHVMYHFMHLPLVLVT